MAHKTLVGGTAYEVTGGKCLVGGTGYSVKKGRALVGGTGYDIQLGRSYIFRIWNTNGTASMLNQQFGITVDGVTVANEVGDTMVAEGATLVIAPLSTKYKLRVQIYDAAGDLAETIAANSTPYERTITGNISVALLTTQATGTSYCIARIYPFLKDIQ